MTEQSTALRHYLSLEELMLVLDSNHDSRAEDVREEMDEVWQRLGLSDREWLSSRE